MGPFEKANGRVSLTKNIDFGRLYAMKNYLGIDETQTALMQFLKVAPRLKRELLTDVEMKTVPLIEQLKLFMLK